MSTRSALGHLGAARTALLIGATMVCGLATGFLFHQLLELAARPKEKSVPQLIRELQKRDSRIEMAWQTLWTSLPNYVKVRFPGLEPVPAVNVRNKAASALAERGPAAKEAIPVLIAALDDPDLSVRTLAIQALGKQGPSAQPALNALFRFFGDQKNNLLGPNSDSPRGHAALALAAVAPAEPRVARILCAALQEKGPAGSPSLVRNEVLGALARVAAETNAVIQTLMFAWKEADPDGAWRKAIEDAEANPPQAFSSFRAADAQVAFAARILGILGKISPPREEVISTLMDGLQSNMERVRSAAVMALANAGPAAARAVPALVKVFEETPKENPALSLPRYVVSPTRFASRQATPNTNQALRSPSFPASPQVAVARQGLSSLFSNANLPEQILWALGRIGSPARAAVPFLLEQSKNQTNRYRLEAALACWRIDPDAQAILPILAVELKREDPIIRRKAARALRMVGNEALPEMIETLKDEDRQVRLAAMESLQALGQGADAAVPMLQQILETDPKNALRISAANALNAIQPQRAEAWKPKLLPRGYWPGTFNERPFTIEQPNRNP